MDDLRCRGYAGKVPVYCAHDKIVPVGEIKPNPKNPNQHPEEQIELLAKIIKTQGWRAPVTVSTLSGFVVRGHGRLMAAQHLGLDCVPVDFQHYSCYDAELADLLADNKIAELAEIDNKMLAEVFQDIDPDAIDMDITGYSEEEYNEIVSALMDATAAPGELDPDEPVEVQEKAVSRLGDIWLLGRHRLMCGNSLDQLDIDKLLAGSRCELTFTDPPYLLETQGGGILKNANSMKQIKENGVDTFEPSKLLIQSETNIYCHNKPLIKKYIELAEDHGLAYDLCFYKKLCTIPNYKGHMMTDCEYIAVIGKQDPNKGLPKEIYSKCYIGKKDHDNELSYSKPVELCAKFIQLYGKGKILDLFGGSGSTLIACEQLHRTCYMMELDPRYVDVIVRRYIGVTGKTNVTLLRDGKEIPVKETGIMD